ncbi:MAG: ketoacyl-ACP synthase III [Verrucomicrobia bacterium]|nr:ketoacyl-ACP synthase III [Verrucomicrobiota bacterium]
MLHPRPANTRAVSIVGTGSYMPERVMTNHELADMVDTTDEWIVSRTGMHERRIAADGEFTSDMAAEAARRAMESAGVTADDIGLLLVSTSTPDMSFPSTACLVQDMIGAENAVCFDLSAACSGFLYGLEVGQQFVGSGSVETALIIGAEKMSCITDWSDRSTCVLFGDGAGAAVLQSRGAKHGILTSVLGSDGSLGDLLMVPGGGSREPTSADTVKNKRHYIKMMGREVFKHAVTNMSEAVTATLDRCGLTIDEIDCIIPHQANARILQAIAQRVGASMDKMFINVDKYGNTSAASVIVALDEAVRAGRVKNHDLVLLVVFGAGFTWGATLLEWFEG